MQGEPLDLFAIDEEPEEYRRVFVEGTFDHAASQVGPAASVHTAALCAHWQLAAGAGVCTLV